MVGLAAYGRACLRLTPRRRWLTLLATAVLPGVVWAALSGQCAFVVGALAIAAVVRLDRRPVLAGVALGLALALKPTLLIMAPLALAATGRWRALAGAVVAGGAAVGLSAILFGVQPWIEWLTVAPGYLAKIGTDPRYATAIISPAVLASQLGLSGPTAWLWKGLCVAAGAAIAVVGLRRARGSAVSKLAFLVGGSLIASPYAMNYETALLAPVAALALTTAGPGRPRALALGGLRGARPRRAAQRGRLCFSALHRARLPTDQRRY